MHLLCRMVEQLRFLDLQLKRLFSLGQSRCPFQPYVGVCWICFCCKVVLTYLKFLLQLGMKFDRVRSETIALHVFPFNSEKKRGGVAVKRVMASFYHLYDLNLVMGRILFRFFMVKIILKAHQCVSFCMHCSKDSCQALNDFCFSILIWRTD